MLLFPVKLYQIISLPRMLFWLILVLKRCVKICTFFDNLFTHNLSFLLVFLQLILLLFESFGLWTCRQLNLLNSILCTYQKWSPHSVVKLLKKVVLRTVGRSHLMASFTWWNEAIIEVSTLWTEMNPVQQIAHNPA